MTNLEKITSTLVKKGALCDDCLSLLANVKPRQTVNSLCRKMLIKGKISRQKGKCSKCKNIKISNKLVKRNKPLIKPEEKTSIQIDFPRYSMDKSSAGSDKRIVLVSCVKTKAEKPLPAEKLYISDLFQKSSAYARHIGDNWFILSAKYGLLTPDQVIAPYEKTLKNMGVRERKTWADQILSALVKIVSPGDEIVFLAGVRYREFLTQQLEDLGYRVSIPMQGLSFGNQLKWLKNKLG